MFCENKKKYCLVFLIFCTFSIQTSIQECEIEDVDNWSENWINFKDVDPSGIIQWYKGKHIKKLNRVIFPDQMNKYFKIDFDESTQNITFEKLEEFNKTYERNENLAVVVIVAEFECEHNKNLTLTVNITDTNNFDPQFTPNPPFTYTIFVPVGGGTPIIPLFGEFGSRDNDLTTYGIEFTIEDNPYFNISAGRSSNHKKTVYYAEVIAKKPIMELKDTLVLNISATDMDLTGEERRTIDAVLTIIPDPHSISFPKTPQFSDTFYKGHLKNKEIEIDNIPLPIDQEGILSFSLQGDMAKYFKYNLNEDTIQIEFDKTTPDDIIKENNYFLFSLNAKNEYSLDGSTVIFVENIKENSDTDLNPVYFTSYYYENNTVTPEIILELSCDFIFSLFGVFKEYFETDCEKDLIKLRVIKELPKNVTLENSKISLKLLVENTLQSIYTTIVIDLILPDLQMDPFTIIEIEEEKEYKELMEIFEEDCEYANIISTWPEVALEWFEIDSQTRKLKTEKIDREHPAIAFLNVSQIQLEILVECKYNNNKNKNVRFTKDSTQFNDTMYDRFWINTKDLIFFNNIQVVNVIVNDINDNAPIFENENPLYLYYPVSDMVKIVRPHSLVIIKANDADIGENAQIKYTTDSDKISIHPETGEIYPIENVFSTSSDKEITFTINATDENGLGKHKTSINAVLKPLNEHNVVMLKINGPLTEGISNIIDVLSDEISCNIVLVSSTILTDAEIPSFNQNNRQKTRKNALTNISHVLFVYVLDKDNKLLDASSVISIFNENNITDGITAETLHPFIKSFNQLCDTQSLVVAVSCLGTILFLVLTVALIAYIYFTRNRLRFPNKYFKYSNNSSMASSSNSMSHPGLTDSKI